MNEGSNVKLTEQEEKFCLIYASGPSPFRGNAQKCYGLVFYGKSGKYGEYEPESVDIALEARSLMLRDDIRTRIDEFSSLEIVSASTLRPRLTEALLKIIDECSTLVCVDRFNRKVSPAALRAVAVNAVSKLTEMYGIKEDIAHKIAIESGDGNGITFNVIVPNKQSPGEDLIG